jgi:transposase
MKMLKREEEQRQAVEMLCTDMVVPKDHLLRKIDKAVDFKYIYTLVADLYSPDNGRPSVDPVVLFKIVLIQHLFGIRSLRQTVKEIELNIGYRWFLGYTMCEPIPHFATVSYAFRQRFGSDIVEQVFQWILTAAQQRGCLSPEAVFIDATHVKANANLQKKIKQAIPQAAKQYEQQLRKRSIRIGKSTARNPLTTAGGYLASNARSDSFQNRSRERTFPQRRTQEVFRLRGTHCMRKTQLHPRGGSHSRKPARQHRF